jgi:cytochrome P450/NADPH-cytochrome P450 reductase
LSVTLTNRQVTNPVIVSYEAHPGRILENRELIRQDGPGGADRSVRHLEIALPVGTTYRAGDHLGVLPRNSFEAIRRVVARFGLDAGQYLTIIPLSGAHTHLPIEEPTPLVGVLGSCVELQDVASRDDIAVLASYTSEPSARAALEVMAGDDEQAHQAYRERVYLPNRSVLDLLEEFPTCALPFEVYLDMLPPLRPRYYSISSSPLAGSETCSITVGVLRAPARSGSGTFTGVSSNHLAAAPVDGTAFVFVRQPSIPFRPPEDPMVPMIMVAAGTGLAPFRGFLQERAAVQGAETPIGPSLLFFGCRTPATDQLYGRALLLRSAGTGQALRPARSDRPRRRRVGPARTRRRPVRLRERSHHRTRRPRGAGHGLRGAHRRWTERLRRLAGGAASRRQDGGGRLGRLSREG